jgi:hypothetical protein
MHNLQEQKKKKKKERANLLVVGNYFTHSPSNALACKSWDLIVMGGLEQTLPANAIFLSIAEAKTCWRAILTCCLKNWMQKNKDK